MDVAGSDDAQAQLLGQVVQLLLSLLGHGLVQQLLQLPDPLLQLRIGEPRVPQRVAQLGEFTLQRVHRGHNLFLLLQRPGDLLSVLEPALILAPVAAALGFAASLQVADLLFGAARLFGQLLHALGRLAQLLLGRALQLGRATDPERVLNALAHTRHGVVVDRPGQVADGVARRERPSGDIQHRAEDADPPHHDLDALDPVVVAGVDHERLA